MVQRGIRPSLNFILGIKVENNPIGLECFILGARQDATAVGVHLMLRAGFDIQFEIPSPVPIVAMLNVHPSRVADLHASDELRIEPWTNVDSFLEHF